MQPEWSNWSGSLRFTPGSTVRPENEERLVALMRQAAGEKRTVRVVGSGHSSSPLVATEDILVSLEKFQGIESYNATTHEATIRAGMTLHDLDQALLKVDLALENLGDVDVQTLAGAVGTGTHGSGKLLKNLSSEVIGIRMVTGTGQIIEWSLDEQHELIEAARISLGVLGIFTALKLRLVPAYQLHRREYCTSIDICLAHLDQLVTENRNFDFYWYPRSDEAKLRTLNLPGQGPDKLSYARCVKDEIGWSGEIIPKVRELKFDEMEYALPAEAGLACFQEVRKRVKERHRKLVGWRVLYRTIAADDAYLSPFYKRDSVTISLHQNASLPFWDYFKDIEPIFQAYGGRPHWGKKHTLKADELRVLYPMWDRFLDFRRHMDPDGRLLNSYLRELLEDA